MSLTRDACCMLWVTMTMVYSAFRSDISCSTCSVATGSSAEQGSSISSTFGSMARARAMHSRCCWPPDSDVPPCRELVLDLVPQRRLAQASLDELVLRRLALDQSVEPRRRGHVVVDGHRRERIRLLEDHPDGAPDRRRLHIRIVDVDALVGDLPRAARPGHDLVHPIEAPQERGLAAAGGTDDRRDRVGADVHRDIADGPCACRTRRSGRGPRSQRPVRRRPGSRRLGLDRCGRAVPRVPLAPMRHRTVGASGSMVIGDSRQGVCGPSATGPPG